MGWRQTLRIATWALVAASTTASAGDLTVYVYPSAKEINWTSPKKTLMSAGLSGVEGALAHLITPEQIKSMMGHVIVHYRCTDEDGVAQESWSGLTGQNDAGETRNDLLRDQIGFSVLFKMYADGSLDAPDVARNLVARNPGRREDGRRAEPLFARFPISSAQECSRISHFQQSFRSRSAKDLLYGFVREAYETYHEWIAGGKSPAIQLAGGCTSYGAGFLKMLGVHSADLERFWRRDVLISERWLGDGRRHKVPLAHVLGPDGESWQSEGYGDRLLSFYDPERMWDFLDGVRTCAAQLQGDKGVVGENCTPELMQWTRVHRDAVNTNASSVVKGNFSRRIPAPSNPKGGYSPPRIVHEVRDVVRHGIDFLR